MRNERSRKSCWASTSTTWRRCARRAADARRTRCSPPWSAEQSGADFITLHLREDRRHIQDRDVRALRAALQTRMNLEIAATPEMLAIALEVQPQDACLVPEKRTEVTTEGGLDVASQLESIAHACRRLAAGGIRVSLFIDPDAEQVDAAARAGAPVVELHTGSVRRGAGGGARARACAARRGCAARDGRRARGECRTRTRLPQRRAGGGDPGARRTQHRPRDRGARRDDRPRAGRRAK